LRSDTIANFKKDAKGLRIVPVNEATYFDIMNSADNEKTREKMLSAFMNRAAKMNTILAQKAISLRQDLAKLLGYKNWFDYKTEPRMAKSSESVRKFLEDLKDKLAALNKQDMEQLLAFKKQKDPAAKKLTQADLSYLEFQMKKQDFKVDGNLVREYFPSDVVIQGMFDVYSQILGVNFVEMKEAPVWSEGVKLYEVRDKKDNRIIGYFYTDFFPREGKYDHAAAFALTKGRIKNGKYDYPRSAIVANLSAPTGDKPSLLSHKDVETMFHEFGHIMHDVLTKAPYASLSGTSTTLDFVEAPSQMLENWVWEPVVLEKISGHYKDHSKKLPKDLLQKMLAARDFQQGRFWMRQLTFGFYDLSIHTDPGAVDVTKTYDEIFHDLMGIDQIANAHFPAGFGHMMGGYDGGYYGYLWSKVYAQDMYTVFQKEGVLSAKVGARYREDILAPGDMEDADLLLKKFLGREPNNKAFFKLLHI
jgi:thimet oligopeptidase